MPKSLDSQGVTSASKFSILRFYERRIQRIFPALFAIVLFCVIVASLVMLPEDLKDFARSEEPLLHTWSLAVEEQFYIYPS